MIRRRFNPQSRINPYAKRINREPSPLLATTVPYASILLASLIPVLFVSSTMAALPPLGFVMLVSWRLMRPELLPSWIGFPLGAFDDLFSGQPFGSAILLWSLAMLIIEWFEARFPWRGFWQDWMAGAIAIGTYVILATLTSGATFSLALAAAMLPQLIIAITAFPFFAGVVAWLDRLRLRRIREVGG